VYSLAYMHEEHDREYARYFSYLNLFAAFMLLLVLGASFPVMFVGWEGVGLCSYLLIGFWYTKPSAANAGKKAFIVNRVGDVGFLLGMFVLWTSFGSLDFQVLARHVGALPVEPSFGVVSLATLLLFVGAMGKSAQIPLHVWLPDAMEGPTPVSALIHAATMVTAGVYMIGRNAVLFSHAPDTLAVVAGVGAATALLAGTIGLVQNDIKRVLAYSTVSQLGLMFVAMGVGAFAAGIFHLYTHAFFKALLFLGAGAVIHALAGEQDIRKMGGLRHDLPVTYWTFLTGALAIAGFPFLSGFFSKDEILWKTFSGGPRVVWGVAALASVLTAVYMFRLVILTFHGARADTLGHHDRSPGSSDSWSPGSSDPGKVRLHDAPRPMAIALVVLAIGSVLAGYVGVPAVLGGDNRIEHYLAPSFAAPGQHEWSPGSSDPGRERQLMAVSTGGALAGILLAVYFFARNRTLTDRIAARWPGLHRTLLNKYYVDEVYDAALVRPIGWLADRGLWKVVDVGILDGAVNGVGAVVSGSSAILRRVQTGSLRAYALSILVGAVVILGYFLWR
jgi:NADH-quinone oxidoreductase subunit L